MIVIIGIIFIIISIISERFIRKNWIVQQPKGRFYQYRHTLHFVLEGLITISFFLLFKDKNDILFGDGRWMFTILSYFFIVSLLRTFVEWKVARKDNLWIINLITTTMFMLHIAASTIVYKMYG
ncbi:DUF4181 domain-containing protein [Bacillus sp. FSL K6-3431]|uniref:DUF4181 domain-containing protein n=1 Tax=Bacillus sp. FSL K6-3431 TaxID=2921500 RepID=UPI004046F2A6